MHNIFIILTPLLVCSLMIIVLFALQSLSFWQQTLQGLIYSTWIEFQLIPSFVIGDVLRYPHTLAFLWTRLT